MSRVVAKKFKGSDSHFYLYRRNKAYEFDEIGNYIGEVHWHFDNVADMLNGMKYHENISLIPLKSVPNNILKTFNQIIKQYE